MGLSSFKFSWWAPKDTCFETVCIMAFQGHKMSLILAPIESACDFGSHYRSAVGIATADRQETDVQNRRFASGCRQRTTDVTDGGPLSGRSLFTWSESATLYHSLISPQSPDVEQNRISPIFCSVHRDSDCYTPSTKPNP